MPLSKEENRSSAMSLSKIGGGRSCQVAGVSGPDRRRLCEMGLVEGAEIDILKRTSPGSVILKVGDCRLALSRGMDRCVQVR
jgi:Fe2+ transport system protein FeoA